MSHNKAVVDVLEYFDDLQEQRGTRSVIPIQKCNYAIT